MSPVLLGAKPKVLPVVSKSLPELPPPRYRCDFISYCSLLDHRSHIGLLAVPRTFQAHLHHVFFSPPSLISSRACADQYSAKYLSWTFWRSPEFPLWTALSSLVLFPENSSCLGLPRLSTPSSQIKERCWALPVFLLPVTEPGNCPGSKPTLVCHSSPNIQWLENHCFIYFVQIS